MEKPVDVARELLASEGWRLFKGEVVDPIYDNILRLLITLPPDKGEFGPVYAGQLQVLERMLHNLYAIAEKE